MCENAITSLEKQTGYLLYREDGLENRSRRINFIIFGVNETPDETSESLREIMEGNIICSRLEVSVKSVERLHRLGRRGGSKTRPVILRFADYREKMHVPKETKKVEGYPY